MAADDSGIIICLCVIVVIVCASEFVVLLICNYRSIYRDETKLCYCTVGYSRLIQEGWTDEDDDSPAHGEKQLVCSSSV